MDCSDVYVHLQFPDPSLGTATFSFCKDTVIKNCLLDLVVSISVQADRIVINYPGAVSSRLTKTFCEKEIILPNYLEYRIDTVNGYYEDFRKMNIEGFSNNWIGNY